MPPATNTSKESPTTETKVVRRVVTTKTTHRTSSSEESVWPALALVATLAVLLAAYVSTHRILKYTNRTESSPISVFDNVLNDEACDRLHRASSEFVGREKNMMFQWPNDRYNNYIERVISSILSEMYTFDETFVVEYWVRQQWHHTIAHADCDESILKQHSVLRHPQTGHVLYLKKGTEVNGPTVVFANVTRGGEMYSSDAGDQEMLIVPFQKGRLLQFDGKLLHAVPRPANLWIHPVMKELQHDPPSKYGRSVVLFNLWKEPPTGLEYSKNEGENVDVATTIDTNKDDLSGPLCNDMSQWRRAAIVSEWQERLWEALVKSKKRFQLPLMGSAARRATNDVTLQLDATDLVEEALVMSRHDLRPKRVYLMVPNEKQIVESNTNDL
jgi:hypothetical protein